MHPYYEVWDKASEHLPIPRWPRAEKLPEWAAYLDARAPADVVNDRIEALYDPNDDEEPMTTLPAIMLRLRYAMTFDAFVDDVLDELREHWGRHPLCA